MKDRPRVGITLTLDTLGPELARFAGYLRAEPADGGAAGFGIEGAVLIALTIGREEWEGLGMPSALPITLHNVRPDEAAR